MSEIEHAMKAEPTGSDRGPVASSGSPSPELLNLFERITECIRDGDFDRVDQLLSGHPEHEQRLRDVLPALGVMQCVKETSEIAALPASSRWENEALGDESVLGDFRLLREIGRGGMGVVYEAQQLSLRRRVAVKVLPLSGVLHKRALARFQNEASAAATLFHPHIVPVFFIGAERGVHFYAMQLIEGASLAEIIAVLGKQARVLGPGVRAHKSEFSGESVASDPSPSVRSNADRGELVTDESETGHRKSEIDTLPFAALSTDYSTNHEGYFRRVAEIGIQVAEALHYAHEHGVLHRDVKPANILLDEYGKAWITDFGLARLETEASMTASGDLLGTVRYMSCEQADGKSAFVDHRTDIYSLGVTLYELIALRSAFRGDDRQDLLRQIANEKPTPLHKLDALIPIDLETIVDKAMAKDPSDRYASAADLAADLRRFQEQRAIHARRPKVWERLLRWSRRHARAVTVGGVAMTLLATCLAVSTWMIWSAKQETVIALESALRQQKLAETHAAEVHSFLYDADVRLAGEAMLQGRVEQVRTLLDRHIPLDNERDLRGFEWHYLWRRVHREPLILKAHDNEVYYCAYSPDGSTLATASKDGQVRVWDSRNGRLLATLRGHEDEVDCVAFFPDGRRLVSSGNDGLIRIWDLDTASEIQQLHGHVGEVVGVAVSPDGSSLASVGAVDFKLKFWDAVSGSETASTVYGRGAAECIAYHPDGHTIAVADESGNVTFWSADAARPRGKPLSHPTPVNAVAYSPKGGFLVTAGRDAIVRAWDVATGQLLNEYRSHVFRIESVSVSPDGTEVASAGDDNVSVWRLSDDLRTSKRVATFGGHSRRVWCVRYAPDGRWASTGLDGTVRIGTPHAESTCWIPADVATGPVALSPDGRTLAISQANGTMVLWNTTEHRELARFDALPASTAVWFAGVDYVIGANRDWFTAWETRAGRLVTRIKNVPVWPGAFGIQHHMIAPDGRCIAVRDLEGVSIMETRTHKTLMKLQMPFGYFMAFSPSGRWLVADVGNVAPNLRMWDVTSGKELKGVNVQLKGWAVFSKVETLLAAAFGDGVFLQDLTSGSVEHLPTGIHGPVTAIAISPDNRTIATATLDGTIQLWRVQTGAFLLELNVPGRPDAVAFTEDGESLTAMHAKGTQVGVTTWSTKDMAE